MSNIDGLDDALRAAIEAYSSADKNGANLVEDEDPSVERITTGSLLWDAATGGGYMRGHSHMLWGVDKAGKTTMGFVAMAAAQARDPNAMCAVIYTEPVNWEWPKKLGVDMSRTYRKRPRTLEEAHMILNALIRMRMFKIILFDSAVGVAPSKAALSQPGDSVPGVRARLWTEWYERYSRTLEDAVLVLPHRDEDGKPLAKFDKTKRRWVGDVYEEAPPALIITNQVREKFGASDYEDPEYIPGGRGLQHGQSLILKIYRPTKSGKRGMTDQGSDYLVPAGMKVQATRFGRLFAEAQAQIRITPHAAGVDMPRELVELVVDMQLFTSASGKKYSGRGSAFWHGEEVPLQEMGEASQDVLDALDLPQYKWQMWQLFYQENWFHEVREAVLAHIEGRSYAPDKLLLWGDENETIDAIEQIASDGA